MLLLVFKNIPGHKINRLDYVIENIFNQFKVIYNFFHIELLYQLEVIPNEQFSELIQVLKKKNGPDTVSMLGLGPASCNARCL